MATGFNRAFFTRWLYVLSLPVVLLNYLFVAVGSLLVGNPVGASQLSLSLYFPLALPLALPTFFVLVAVRTVTPIQKFSAHLTFGLGAVLVDVLLALVTYVPNNTGTKLASARTFSSLASRLTGLPVDASSHLATGLLVLLPFVLVYLLIVGATVLRRRKLAV